MECETPLMVSSEFPLFPLGLVALPGELVPLALAVVLLLTDLVRFRGHATLSRRTAGVPGVPGVVL